MIGKSCWEALFPEGHATDPGLFQFYHLLACDLRQLFNLFRLQFSQLKNGDGDDDVIPT